MSLCGLACGAASGFQDSRASSEGHGQRAGECLGYLYPPFLVPVADAENDSLGRFLDTQIQAFLLLLFQEKGFIQTYYQACNKAMEEQGHLLALYNSHKTLNLNSHCKLEMNL